MRLKLFLVLLGWVVLTFAVGDRYLGVLGGSGATAAEVVTRARHGLGIWLLCAVPLAAILATATHLLFSRSLRDLLRTARRMAEGDLAVRSPFTESEPLAPLGQTLDRLASNLSSSLVELRNERDLVGRILERMDEGVMVLDEDRRVVLINASLRDMLLPDPALARLPGTDGRTTSGEVPSLLDVRGKTALELFRHAELEGLLDQTELDPGRSTGEIEVGGLKPRTLLVRAVRFQGATGASGYLLVFVDVTDIRRLESLRRDFVANVSHELRTPVAAVRSAAETIRVALDHDRGAADRFVDIIERNAERLQNLIEDLLDLSRIESREFRLNVESLDLGKVVQYIFGLFRDRAERRRIQLRADVPSDFPALHTDRRALEQVLSNLIDNAVKYCPEDSSITVRVAKRGDLCRIAVEDNGPGIEAKHLARLFERFYRVDAGRSRDRGGTGLGLSIVKHLAEAMGGQAGVESTVGKGSTFFVTVPLSRSQHKAA